MFDRKDEPPNQSAWEEEHKHEFRILSYQNLTLSTITRYFNIYTTYFNINIFIK